MAHRVSLRYLATKLVASAEEVAIQLQSSASSSLSDALTKGMEAFRRQLTAVGVLTGAAMAPTLNASALTQPASVEKFLMRLVPRPMANRTIFEGDVIAFTSPLTGPGSTEHVMVRRVAALEGDEMTSDDPAEEEFVIPKDHCWVLADNEASGPPEVLDSRAFGPLPLHNVLGRVVYSAKSETDHGPVENSEPGMAADAPILEAELDIDRLFAEEPKKDESE